MTSTRIERAAAEPQNWLTYNGGYTSQRYSPLTEINAANVGNLELKWMVQNQVFGAWQSNPLVVDGIMYVTQRPNDIMAIDARTGAVYWLYRYTVSDKARVCCGANNRGVAILGDTVFMGTLDAHLVAVDAKNGHPIWNTTVGDVDKAYSITMAPLVVKDKVLVGVGGGEFGIRGFVAAYDAKTGKEAWRFYTIPAPGEPGHDTWSADDWEHGGAPAWITGSYDPQLNLTYWGIGNPGPDWNPKQRPGDNLYSDCVVALDADTGTLKWHFQFTPNDGYDYDSVQVPVLADINWRGQNVKAMMWANRNGFFYILDRATGRFLLGQKFVTVNWASGLDENGRPMQTPQPEGQPTYPGNQGGTNWYPPSFSPRTGLFYFAAWDNYGSVYRPEEVRLPGRPQFRRRRIHRRRSVDRRAHRRHWPPRSDQQLDERSWQGRRDGNGSTDRSNEMEVRTIRRVGQRHADDGVGPAVYGRTRRTLPRARCQDRKRTLAREPRRPDRDGAGHLPG